MQARHRGRFIVLIALALVTSGTVTHADPDPAPASIPVYIFAGQSNMVGASASIAELTDAAPELADQQRSVLFFGPDDKHARRWAPLVPPTEISQTTYGPGFGPEVSAAAALAHGRHQIAIVKYAKNGTNLYHDWDPSRPDGLYHALIARTRAALALLELRTHKKTRVAAFIWMQGEGDTYLRSTAADYEANLTNLVMHVRGDFQVPHLRVVIGRIAFVAGRYSSIVRAAQRRVARDENSVSIVETDDLPHDASSLVHLDTNGEIDLGRRFARALQ